MYKFEKPHFPFLHKCNYCHRRINKNMKSVSCRYGYGNALNICDWYCSKECARKSYLKEQLENNEEVALTDYVKGKNEQSITKNRRNN